MRMPRLRFTVQGMMVAVAIAALAIVALIVLRLMIGLELTYKPGSWVARRFGWLAR